MLVSNDHHHWSSQVSASGPTSVAAPSSAGNNSSTQPRRVDQATHPDWDLSELFQSAIDPRNLPAGGFAPPHHYPDAEFEHQPSLPVQYNRPEFLEHGYDLFNAAPSSFAPNRHFNEPQRRQTDAFPYPSYNSPVPASLGSVPEDSVVPHPPHSPFHAPGTISPGALAAGERHPAQPSFAELMDRHPQGNSFYAPRNGLHRQHSYPFPSDPSSSAATTSMPRQFDSPYPPNYQPIRPSFLDTHINSPYLNQYIHASNRLAAGEQTVIVMSSRVAQKSYGNEKRFLCPPPTAVLLGHSWWSDSRGSDGGRPSSTQVTISISGEAGASDGTLEWSTPAGKPIDHSEDYADESAARIGRCVGKQLFISDVDERKKRVEALVKINIAAQHGDRLEEHVVGTFSSRPIKVISKPSKKRQSAKNLELCINHGSTVSLFHRLRSQTVSTKYLCVSGSGASFKGSDGAALPGLDIRQRVTAPSFVAKTASWDMFIIYIVDVNRPTSTPDSAVPPPFQPDYPPPPPNAIPCSPDNSSTPIYYNQTVVLQCLTSGVVSPVLIIRKVDHSTVVVGGGLAESTKGVPDHHCIPGEVCGDPVSQLHKIAFEVYEPSLSAMNHENPGGPGFSGAFLSCMGEKVNTYRPVDVRQWNGSGNGSPERSVSGSPLTSNSTLTSKASSPDPPYFPPPHMQNSNISSNGHNNASPLLSDSFEFMGDNGGRIRRKRGSLTHGVPPSVAAKSPVSRGGRRRVDSVSSISSRTSGDGGGGISGALWSIDIGETAVWTIVGTDQVRYNFFVPPTVREGGRTLHLPQTPVTPALMVHKCISSDHPNSNSSNAVVSLHGENFSKSDPPLVFFGTEQSQLVEVRSSELLVCRPPAHNNPSSSSPSSPLDGGAGQNGGRRPVILVRSDGVVYPTSILYP
ncbi:hypothetical protein BS47DRAFT_1388799 [Hydnum rufescens UP504]|uniref:LAG1-DNAbind-domain-containing protein n=1 Tax=Hydnum rufescens UP504 TaxID=1448309 RepID=A0A9P6B731_9AGAM|nr:hypothetical protein BS47DRAFT_1388799 [Hydnum rufescens UP504]